MIDDEYIWFDGMPVAQQSSTGEIRWTFTDHLGTPILQTSSLQGIVWRAEYEPYGRIFELRAQDVHQPLRLPGQEAEQLNAGANGATDRSYNIHRWYQADVGGFTLVDPKGLVKGEPNPYLYARGNPINNMDPLGLDTVGCDFVPNFEETPCVLQCCAVHDRCYDQFHCSANSWRHPKNRCDKSLGCSACNIYVASCIAECKKGRKKSDPKAPLYYCASQHRFVSIPGDFKNRKEAEKACRHDDSRDCVSACKPEAPLTLPPCSPTIRLCCAP